MTKRVEEIIHDRLLYKTDQGTGVVVRKQVWRAVLRRVQLHGDPQHASIGSYVGYSMGGVTLPVWHSVGRVLYRVGRDLPRWER